MKLMIVDDHPGVRTLIRQLAASPGDVIQECSSGDEAVRQAPEFKPDWVTLDIRMPGLNAFAALRAIRWALPSVRVIVVTSYDQPEFRGMARESGVHSYVVKENLSELRELVSGLSSN
jgi:DNA-binding NarL/FixJ family response regulator